MYCSGTRDDSVCIENFIINLKNNLNDCVVIIFIEQRNLFLFYRKLYGEFPINNSKGQ